MMPKVLMLLLIPSVVIASAFGLIRIGATSPIERPLAL
jgi:hypothetical protein